MRLRLIRRIELTTKRADDNGQLLTPRISGGKSHEQCERTASRRKNVRRRGEGLRRLSLRQNVRSLESDNPGEPVYDAAPRGQTADAGHAAVLQKLGTLFPR